MSRVSTSLSLSVARARALSLSLSIFYHRYDSWTSELDSATEFPYFIRVGPANSDISKVVGVFLRSMGWFRIAIVTDDDSFTSDYGKGVANDMEEHGGSVLYHGVRSKLTAMAVSLISLCPHCVF